MKKSISSFALGLIFSIIGAIAGYFFWFVFTLVGAFSQGVANTIFTILPLINFITFIVSFIGSFFCLWKAKIGGIIMLISSTISAICLITVLAFSKSIQVIHALFIIPTLVILITSILAIIKKPKTQNETVS